MKPRIIKSLVFVAALGLTITASAQSSGESGDDTKGFVMLLIFGILVLGGLVGGLFLLKREKRGSPKVRPCPVCGSSNTKTATVGLRGISIPALRQCDSCGTLWRPECSSATTVMTVVTGFVLLGLTIGSVYFSFFICIPDIRRGDSATLVFFIMWSIFSCVLFAASIRLLQHGFKLLRGQGRSLEVLTKGREVPAERRSNV